MDLMAILQALASRISGLLDRLSAKENLDPVAAEQVQFAIECLRRAVYAIAGDARTALNERLTCLGKIKASYSRAPYQRPSS